MKRDEHVDDSISVNDGATIAKTESQDADFYRNVINQLHQLRDNDFQVTVTSLEASYMASKSCSESASQAEQNPQESKECQEVFDASGSGHIGVASACSVQSRMTLVDYVEDWKVELAACAIIVSRNTDSYITYQGENCVVKLEDQIKNVEKIGKFQDSQDSFLRDAKANIQRMIRQLADLQQRNSLIQQLNAQQLASIGTLSQSLLQQSADADQQRLTCRSLSGPINELADLISDVKVSSADQFFNFFFCFDVTVP